ncbi:MAG: PGF-pre-PGF domain-containing protein [Candidatus Aenigmarchaeota archaeon]|nr:PGF-pre-PGF domain-containing protein [Candidatus Aenigmarchaeota archaeon]
MAWGMVLIAAAVVVLVMVTTGPREAAAQEGPSANFSFWGYVKYPNGTFVAGVNITVEAINFSAAVNGPPPTAQVISNLSTSTGFFNVSNILGGLNYQVKIRKFNGTNVTVSWIGPTLPPFPDVFLKNDSFGIANSTFVLQRAANMNLSVINASGQHRNFTYQIIDKKLGFPIETPEFNESKYANSSKGKMVAVPYNRNYTVEFFPYQSAPLEVSATNLSIQNTSPDCFNDDNCDYFLGIQVNTSTTPVYVHGFINTTDFGQMNRSTANFTNLSVVTYLVFGGDSVMSQATLPPNMGQFIVQVIGGGPKDIINATGTNGTTPEGGPFYNITLPGTTTGFEVLMVFYGTSRSAQNINATNLSYVGFQNVTVRVGQGNIEINQTLQRLAGAVGVQTFSDTTMPSIVTNLTTINLTSPDSTSAVGQAHMEARLTYTMINTSAYTRQYRWFIETDQTTSTAKMPIPNTTTDLRFQIFSQNFAPIKKDISNALLNSNGTLNIKLYQMDIKDPDQGAGTGGLKSSVQMVFYTSSSACDVPTPLANCSLSNFGSAQEFNPMKAMLGGSVSLRMTQSTGVTVHYVNVDLLASGPPDASMDTDTDINKTSGTGFGEIWKFGSSGPTVYDYVLIGIPYTDDPGDLEDEATVNISIPVFYDNDWVVIWNASSNGTNASALAANFTDYSSKATEWTTLMNNNTCATTLTVLNATQPCFINTSENMVWFRIPHFSGTGPSITGATVETPATPAPSSGSSSSSGGGGGGGSTTSTDPKATKIWGIINPATEATFEITKTEIGISEIAFSVANPAQNVQITVQKLSDKPAALPETGTSVYQYVEITKTNLEDSALLGAAKIQFKIPNSWLAENGIDKAAVALHRYTSQWDALPTTLLSTDVNSTSYQATTPGFSTFAIGGTPAAAPVVESCGDGTCDADETFETCPADCPAPAPVATCVEGEVSCLGETPQDCTAGQWVTREPCTGLDCPENPCAASPETGAGEQINPVFVAVIGVIIVLVIAGVFLYRRK